LIQFQYSTVAFRAISGHAGALNLYSSPHPGSSDHARSAKPDLQRKCIFNVKFIILAYLESCLADVRDCIELVGSGMAYSKMAEKVIQVLELAVKCPMGEALRDCPAKHLRTTPAKERVSVLESMDESLLDQVIAHHQACFHRRHEPQN
jgi:hypothetical protein